MLMMDHWEDNKEVDISSNEEAYDSDQICSDVEAELYSVIHHETDNSTSNIFDSFYSPNTSDKENKSYSLSLGEQISNNFEKSIQIMSANNLTNLEENRLSKQYHPLKRKSNSDYITLDESIESCSKKHKSNVITGNKVNGKFDDTVELSSSDDEDDNKIVCLDQEENDIFSSDDQDDNDIVRLEQQEKDNVSSDDDNDIICIESSDKKNRIETNVSEIIVADSDSDTVDSWCFNFSANNTSTPSTSKNKDLWYVNTEDLYRSRRSSNRYHESQLTCTLCNQRGHSSKFCSSSKGPKCFICGGPHNMYRCKNRVCAKCLGWGHDIRNCPKGVDVCAMCQMPGHHENSCPDLWRRFQRTTKRKAKKIWRLPQKTPYFCYNCGLSGHFGAVCRARRMNISCFPTWPFVLNYKVQNEGKAKSKMLTGSNVPNNNQSGQQKQTPKQKKQKKKKKKNSPNGSNQQEINFPRTPKIKLENDTITNVTPQSSNNNIKIELQTNSEPIKSETKNRTSPKTYGPLNLTWQEYRQRQKSKKSRRLRNMKKRERLQQLTEVKIVTN